MNLKWLCVILSIIIGINALPESEIEAFIDLTGLGYEDACNKAAESRWDFVKKSNNVTQKAWEDALDEYAEYKRTQENEIVAFTNETLSSSSLQYKYNLIKKPGDALLNAEDWHEFVSFVGEAESSNNVITHNSTNNEEKIISLSDKKLKEWTLYYNDSKTLTTRFSRSLTLIESAAIANGMESVDEYWEMLSNYQGGYEKIKEKWSDIAMLHKRIVDFVRNRLALKYPEAIKDEQLPIHLFDTNQAHDWTQLALDIVPYPDITFEIRKNMLANNLIGSNLYKSAARLGNILFKQVPQAPFWEESEFKGQCPSQLINLCDGNMRLSTCSDSSIRSYLSAHKDVATILLNQISTESNPILNMENRYSGLNAGISEIFGILSMSRASLLSQNLIKETDDLEEIRVVSLMITALDVLPRMAYYLAADTWRLDSIKNKTLDPDELTAAWWEYRSSYEGISTFSTETPTFLKDHYIVNNKPYLSKFLGALLAFQIYEHLMDSTEMRYENIESITPKHELMNLIQFGSADNWHEAVTKYLEIYDVSVDSLLSYFSPLEQYLDEIEDKLTIPIPYDLEEALQQMEYEHKRKSQTLPISSTSKAPIISTTPKASIEQSSEHSEIPPSESKIESKPVNTQYQSENIQIQSNRSVKAKPIVKENIDDSKNDEILKSETNKAVWSVGAVLIATVTIVIIAIFGRRRCRKTPKNRRYV